MGRTRSPSRPISHSKTVHRSIITICWVLLTFLVVGTGTVTGFLPFGIDGATEQPTVPPPIPTETVTTTQTPPPETPTTVPPTPTPTTVLPTPTTAPPTPTPTAEAPTPTTAPPTPTQPPKTPTPTTAPPTPSQPPKTPTSTTAPPTTVQTTSAVSLPPVLSLAPPETSGLSARIGGGALSGAAGQSVIEVYWDWGDGSHEVHAFPNTHTYAGSGTYIVVVRATQSDGRSTEKTTSVTVTNPTTAKTTATTAQVTTALTTVPATTIVPAGIPIIGLTQPSVENQTVVIGGSVLPGGPTVTVDAIEWDWGDQTRIRSNEIPATHTYLAAGSYTITVTVFQSDGQTATASFPVGIIQVPGTYVTTGTPMPNGSGWQFPTVRLFGINILPLILLLMVGLIAGGILYARNRESDAPEIPTTDAIEQAAAAYHEAKERGDLPEAKRQALDAARLLVIQAEAVPRYRNAYLEKAEIWKEIARPIIDGPAQGAGDPTDTAAPLPGSVFIPGTAVLPDDDMKDPVDETSFEGGALLTGTDVEPAVFDAVLRIALEIAREGREGKPVGTAFLVGDLDGVLAYSTQFILNPFKGHTMEERRVTNEELAENIKEFAQLDGAFVIAGDGLVEAAGRYITVDTSAVQIPPGLGSRHASVAGITLVTRAIGIVVSQSGGLIKVFRGGQIVRTVSPW